MTCPLHWTAVSWRCSPKPPHSLEYLALLHSPWPKISIFRKRAEYCFESTVSEKRTHWASLSSAANSVSSAKNSVSSLWHTNNRLRGTHWVRSPELSEPRKTHWVRCLKPCSPKPYSARFRLLIIRLPALQGEIEWLFSSDSPEDFAVQMVEISSEFSVVSISPMNKAQTSSKN